MEEYYKIMSDILDVEYEMKAIIYVLDELDCKLRSNGMPVPLLRNGYSIFNGTKYR